MSLLDRKLARDLVRLRGSLLAAVVVTACGVASFIALRGMSDSLRLTLERYYAERRFAHVFAELEQAPDELARALRDLPGVAVVETRVVTEVPLQVPGASEPAVGRLTSLPDEGRPALGDVFLRSGRLPSPGSRDEVLVSEGFAGANALEKGGTVGAVINGRWQPLRVVGVALSPEYVYEARGGAAVFPDPRRFGVIWMRREALATALDIEGSFNSVALLLAPRAVEADVLRGVDRLLNRYGGRGAYGRADQMSHRFVLGEIAETASSGVLLASIFLAVTAFLLNVVLNRVVALEREPIAVLKAFGYSDAAVGGHFLKLALVTVATGSAVGVALGAWLARGLAAAYHDIYHFPRIELHLGAGVIAAAVLSAAAASLGGALVAVRRVVRLPPAEAMRPPAPERYRRSLLERGGLFRRLPLTGRMLLRHLERHPGRTLVTVLGISLGLMLVFGGRFVFSAVSFLKETQFRHVQREDATVTLWEARPLAAALDLTRQPDIWRAEPFRAVPVRLRAGRRELRSTLLGLEPGASLRPVVERGLRVRELPLSGVLLTGKLAEMLGVGPGDRVEVEVLEGKRPVRQVLVAGLVDELIGTAVYLRRRDLNRLLGEGDLISGAHVTVDPRAGPGVYQRLARLPEVSSVSVRQAALESFESTVEASFQEIIFLLIAFACALASGVVYNGLRITLSERERELATLQVLGFSRREVAVVLLGEHALLTLAAIPPGWLGGVGVSWVIARSFDSEIYRLPFVLDGATFAFAALVVLVAALLSALAVGRRLGRLDPTAALRTRE